MTSAARLRKWADDGDGRRVEFDRKQVAGGSLCWIVTATLDSGSINARIVGAPTPELEAASRDAIQALEAAGETIPE